MGVREYSSLKPSPRELGGNVDYVVYSTKYNISSRQIHMYCIQVSIRVSGAQTGQLCLAAFSNAVPLHSGILLYEMQTTECNTME